ncbi:MAG: TonB-dependent receptor [Hyphomonadaceae bacterium]
MLSKKFLSGAALTALSMAMPGIAYAQSTASQIQEDEVIVVRGNRQSIDGAIVAEQSPKARATITQDFIDQQQSGQTILNTIGLIPGVQFDNSDAYGSSGGNLTIRGFDGNRISLTFDGVPLNDTGNYAIYSNQQMDPELITRANVNMGTTDVDSPTASAVGGTVNYVTVLPDAELGGQFSATGGSENFRRVFGRIDSGEIGPFDTSMFAAVSRTQYDHFVGPGTIDKTQYNARIYQPLGEGSDFISVAFHYNENRNNFYRGLSLSQFNSGASPVYDASCTVAATGPGAQGADGCSNYIGVRINPSNTGNIRGQARFDLTDAVTLTIDPSYQFVRANGGGTETVSETNGRLGGPLDLNNDGDTLDTIRLYSPSNTTTNRYGITSSLLWDLAPDHRIRFGYTYDYGDHRQTGEYALRSGTGDPFNVFGGRVGFGTPIITNDGIVFQKRNRSSIATLSQFSAEYRGDFMNDAVTLVVGVRAPEFERELDQRCYAVAGSTSSTQYCTMQTPTLVDPLDPDGFVTFGGATQYSQPFQTTVTYDDVLPNIGVVWRPAENHQIFFSYAESLSAPRTDDLYGGNTVEELNRVEPETSQAYDLGWRYQTGDLIAGATVWFNQFQNRIIRSVDPNDPTFAISRNVGDVELWGVEGQIGFRPTENLSLFASASYSESELQNNLPGQVVGQGLTVPGMPDWTFAARGEYDLAPFTFGLQARYTGERVANDFNTETAPDYTLVDLDVRWDLTELINNERLYLQLNVTNLFDERFLSTLSTGVNGGTGFYSLGAPRAITLQLRAEF